MFAALLLLSSPVFLAQLMLPMTDVPVAAGWALVCLFALKQPRPRAWRPAWLCGSGAAHPAEPAAARGGADRGWFWPAFAARDRRRDGIWNVAAVRGRPGAGAWWPSRRSMRTCSARRSRRATAGFGEMYGLGSAPQNLRNYGTWLVQAQTPLVAHARWCHSSCASRCDRRLTVSSVRACLAALLAADAGLLHFLQRVRHLVVSALFAAGFPALFVLMAAGVRECLS